MFSAVNFFASHSSRFAGELSMQSRHVVVVLGLVEVSGDQLEVKLADKVASGGRWASERRMV